MDKELKTAEIMIGIYCLGNHGSKKSLCQECEKLFGYVTKRLDKCPFRENKPKCSKCPAHCYKPAMRKKIKEVMKYSGPRMILKHPVLAARHLLK